MSLVQHDADALQRSSTLSHPDILMAHVPLTPYLPRLRVLKDRYMRSSCKGVNSVIQSWLA